MNRALFRNLTRLASLAILVFIAANLAADDAKKPDTSTQAPNTLTDKEKADGWKLLFDGKSLDGWRIYKKPDVSGWEVKDDAIVRTTGGDLITKEKYGSFELTVDYKISPGGNSGVVFHVTEEGEKPWNSGPEVQILDFVPSGHEVQLAGWLYQLYQPPNDPKTGKPVDAGKAAGQWNTLRIVAKGPHLETYLNGVKYIECEMWSDDWNARVAKSKFSKFPYFGKAKTGYINLQDHKSEIAFRNVKIRVLEEK